MPMLLEPVWAAWLAGPALCALAQWAWWLQFRGGPAMPTESRAHLSGACLRAAATLLLLAGAQALLPQPMVWATVALLAVVWTTLETLNLAALKFFNLPAHLVWRHLPRQAAGHSGLGSTVATARDYVRWPLWLGLLPAAGAALWLAVRSPAGAAAAAALAWALAAALRQLRPQTGRLEPRLAEAAFLGLDDQVAPCKPGRSPRPQAVRLAIGRQAQARHVLIIINESAGDDVPASTPEGGSLAERLCALGAGQQHWLRPSNVVTPSSCTDITLPCLLTGAAPQHGHARFAQLPTVFDMARARGLRTLFYSAGSLQWANLEGFMDFHAQDDVFSPQLGKLPFINDLGCDDYLVAQRLSQRILSTDEPLCMVVYFHGLHLPFQKDSACGIPDTITDRRRRAAHVTEASHALLFDALRQSGRFDDTLIVSVGDHGEAFGVDPGSRSSRQSRLTRLSATVTRPMFILKPPRGLEPGCQLRLQANAGQLLSLIDVAPTVASALAVELVAGQRHAGHDLLRHAVPDDRVHYTLTVTDWRSWPQAAVMIAQGRHRVCIDHQTRDHLCCDGQGQALPAATWAQTSRLLGLALHEPLVQKSITQVFRDKLADRVVEPPRVYAAAAEALAAVPPRLRAAPGGFEAFYGADFRPGDAHEGRLHCAEGCQADQALLLTPSRRGILVYGPYIDLAPGRYRASFLLAPDAAPRPLDIDVVSADNPRIQALRVAQLAADGVASITFELQHAATLLEVRLHSPAGFSGRCLGLHLAELARPAVRSPATVA